MIRGHGRGTVSTKCARKLLLLAIVTLRTERQSKAARIDRRENAFFAEI